METLPQRIERITREHVSIVSYDPRWPALFEEEKKNLLSCLPRELIGRVEHFGSTAIPGMAAKPIVDILVEVTSLEDTKAKIVPILEARGYEYFWRPSHGDNIPPFYAWFIKRNPSGIRTHHIHMVEKDFEQWDRLLFRDYLIEHADVAAEYQSLKLDLATMYPNDRVAYTDGKTEFVIRITQLAKNTR